MNNLEQAAFHELVIHQDVIPMSLCAWNLAMDVAVALPPSLTALYLGQNAPSATSPKLDILLKPMRQLRHIGLRGFDLSGVDFSVFGSTLERLSLRDCGALPSAVSLADTESDN
ncbi:hypothetical protein D9Q98_005923 [Chlorella vulgaris]|uniref:Uncharacterized protein n=1 Tax=Chlorella vulgaris TaxID=3077 RepID=A0A9D4TWU9_CHLVU|nr:hypothetical protein D9Q98_005923 [Chlorella vulgaris]